LTLNNLLLRWAWLVFAVTWPGCADLVGADFNKHPSGNHAPTAGDLATPINVIQGTQNNRAKVPSGDVDGDVLKHRIIAGPSSGTVTWINDVTGEFRYATQPGALLTDSTDVSFSYQVTDGLLEAAKPGRVNIHVRPFGPIPLVIGIDDYVAKTRPGTGLDFDGDTVIIGAENGAAYLAKRQLDDKGQPADSWRTTQTIYPPQGFENSSNMHFGWSVALSGEWALVGAWGEWPPAPSPAGRAFFYKRGSDGLFKLVQTLQSPIGSPPMVGDGFGWDVSLDVHRACVSALRQGTVYTYEYSATTGRWVLDVPGIGVPTGKSSDDFGMDTSLEGDTLAISAPGDDGEAADSGVGENAGAVYIFQKGTSWQQQIKLLPTGENTTGYSMRAIALSGNQLLAGASATEPVGGLAYVFERHADGKWDITPKSLPNNASIPRFGWSVALEGDVALVTSLSSNDWLGRVAIFRKSPQGWQEQEKREIKTGSSDQLGLSLALAGENLAIGAPKTGNEGAVYFYNLPAAADE
jgi:hypothetical protein